MDIDLLLWYTVKAESFVSNIIKLFRSEEETIEIVNVCIYRTIHISIKAVVEFCYRVYFGVISFKSLDMSLR